MTSRSPYRDQTGTRRCSTHGCEYRPSASGCPRCRAVAAKHRKLRPWPTGRKCRACGLHLEVSHPNQWLHEGCREEWQYQQKRKADDAREARKREQAARTGLCRWKGRQCPRPATSGTLCEEHRQLHRQRNRSVRELHGRLGTCRDCRRPARPGGVYCAECCAKVAANARRWRDRNRARRYWTAWVRPVSWLCVECRGPVAYDGRGRPALRCEECREAKAA